jgi:hypothetical protein
MVRKIKWQIETVIRMVNGLGGTWMVIRTARAVIKMDNAWTVGILL